MSGSVHLAVLLANLTVIALDASNLFRVNVKYYNSSFDENLGRPSSSFPINAIGGRPYRLVFRRFHESY